MEEVNTKFINTNICRVKFLYNTNICSVKFLYNTEDIFSEFQQKLPPQDMFVFCVENPDFFTYTFIFI